MKRYEEGEKSSAICEMCAALQPTTFRYRDVPFSDGSGTVPNILVAVCDGCGEVVATPPQSTPAIRKARKDLSVSVEAKLPAPALAILDLALYRLDPSSAADLRKMLLVKVAADLSAQADAGRKMDALRAAYGRFRSANSHSPMRRLSFKLSRKAYRPIGALTDLSGAHRTEVLGCLIMQIDREIVRPAALPKAKAWPSWIRAVAA
jgi:hypothetical protein